MPHAIYLSWQTNKMLTRSHIRFSRFGAENNPVAKGHLPQRLFSALHVEMHCSVLFSPMHPHGVEPHVADRPKILDRATTLSGFEWSFNQPKAVLFADECFSVTMKDVQGLFPYYTEQEAEDAVNAKA